MLLRSTLIYFPALLLPRIATFALVIVATHLLAISEYGLFALVTAVGEVAEGVSTNWVRLAIVRLSGATPVFPAALWRATARANRLTTIVAIALVLPAALVLVPDRWLAFWLSVSAYVFAMALLRFGLHVLQSIGARRLYALVEASRAPAIFGLPVGVMMLAGDDFVPASLAMSAATAVFGLWALALARRHVAEDGMSISRRDMTVFAGPMIAVTAVGVAVLNMERMILQVLAGPAAVGAYSAAYALARQPFEILSNAVNVGGFPQLVDRYERDGAAGAREAVMVQLDLLLGLLVPAIAGIAALRGEIAAAILPGPYRETAAAILPWIALASGCYALRSTVLDNIFHLQKRSWMLLTYLGPAALVSIGAAAVLIPLHGAMGAAVAFTAGSVTSLVVASVVARRLVPIGPALRSLASALLCAAAVALVAHGSAAMAGAAPPLLTLLAGLAAGTAAFLLSQLTLRHRQVVPMIVRAMPPARAWR